MDNRYRKLCKKHKKWRLEDDSLIENDYNEFDAIDKFDEGIPPQYASKCEESYTTTLNLNR